MIKYSLSKNDEELQQILDLQKENLPAFISVEEQGREGFVTVHHHLDLLRAMNAPFPHVIAKDQG